MWAWGLLGLGSAALLLTLNAFWSLRRPVWLLPISFFASWLTLELVVFHLMFHLATAGLMIWNGALSEVQGVVGLCLVAAACVGLLKLWRTSIKAADVMREEIGEGEVGGFPLVNVLVPFWFKRSGVKVTKNVEYGRAGGQVLRLDVYESGKREVGKRPALLQIHGGGWVVGDKREQGLPLVHHMASQGWVCFNVNYRLSPWATFPDHLVDIKRARAWIRGHADEYGIDPDFVAVTGGSAGGHLASLMGLTWDDERYKPGFEAEDVSVQAVASIYGVYDFCDRLGLMRGEFVSHLLERWVMKAFLKESPEMFSEASPLDRVREDAPPFLVVHGDRDTLSPVEYAELFAERLRKASCARVYLTVIPGAQHAFDVFLSPRTARVLTGVELFLKRCWGDHINARESKGTEQGVDEEGIGAGNIEEGALN